MDKSLETIVFSPNLNVGFLLFGKFQAETYTITRES
jgi:hypothetical protein